MGLPIVWSAHADDDLATIVEYVGQRNSQAAGRLWSTILDSVNLLPENPYLYKPSARVLGCREIVVLPNYIVVFKVESEQIRVLRVLHARQQFP